MYEELILTVLMTSVPLVYAAIGELVVERSGVLNLGVEGMMLMGAVAAFGATGSVGAETPSRNAGTGGGGNDAASGAGPSSCSASSVIVRDVVALSKSAFHVVARFSSNCQQPISQHRGDLPAFF